MRYKIDCVVVAIVIAVKNCGELPSVDGGVWNATNIIEGSSTVFSCYPGYEIEGTSNIVTCVNNSWVSFGDFNCILIGVNASSTVEVDTSIQSKSSIEGLYTANQPTTSSNDRRKNNRTIYNICNRGSNTNINFCIYPYKNA